jgi:hypothetical protein
LSRARYRCAPDVGNASLGNSFHGDLRRRFGTGSRIREMMMSANPEPTTAQDLIERRGVGIWFFSLQVEM